MNIHSYQDIVNNKNIKIGTVGGAINSQNMVQAGIPLDRQVLLPDNPSLIAALKAGRVDAGSLSRGMVANLMSQPGLNDGLEVATPFKGLILPDGKEKVGYAAFAFRPDSKSLADAFNKALAKMEKNGQLLDILKKYGFDQSALPGGTTEESLCKG
jgi:polar amino acid transport system substrate-binding protein